jgi:molecular chaperone IbpA
MNTPDPFRIPEHLEKFFLGGEKIVESLQRAQLAAKNFVGYPPYNIVKLDNDRYLIEMAVAGFPKGSVEVEIQEGTLTVTGKIAQDDDQSPTKYLYQGIAERPFTRKFELADSIQVRGAEMFNGLLRIALENVLPEEKKAHKVEIVNKDYHK